MDTEVSGQRSGFEWARYGSVCIQFGANFWYTRFCMATVFIWSISGLLFYGFNLYVIGKKNVLSLFSVISVLWIVFKVVKIQVISSCSESKICSLVDIMFQHISVLFFFQDWLTDFSHIYWISTLRKQHEPKELSLHMMIYEKRKYFIFGESCVKRPCTAG